MRRARGPRRQLPAALKFMLAVLILAALAYPFRLPPASQAESDGFYMVDGSDTARVLRAAAGELRCELEGAGGVLSVDARVEVPDVERVPVLRVRQGGVDVATVQAALGLRADAVEVAESNVEIYGFRGYDVKYQLLWYDNGTLDLNEAGRFRAYLYEPGRVYAPEELVELLRAGGLLAGEARVLTLDGGATTLIQPVYSQLPVSGTFAFDSYTGHPSVGAALMVEQRMDGTMLSVEGQALGQAEEIWHSARVISPEDALRALAAHCQRDELVERIVLAYHVRTIYGDPFNVLLYPVWEVYAQSTGELNASIVNAITGQVEQLLLGADERAGEAAG